MANNDFSTTDTIVIDFFTVAGWDLLTVECTRTSLWLLWLDIKLIRGGHKTFNFGGGNKLQEKFILIVPSYYDCRYCTFICEVVQKFVAHWWSFEDYCKETGNYSRMERNKNPWINECHAKRKIWDLCYRVWGVW